MSEEVLLVSGVRTAVVRPRIRDISAQRLGAIDKEAIGGRASGDRWKR
jgi:hypothetical protein